MKTRSNMPLFVVETNDVKALSNSQIDLLRCGDYLVKKDASGEHAYKVTFKSDTGMCITYMDAYCVETQSYDKVDGNWVYNSEDKTIIAEPSLENIVDAQGHNRFVEGNITPSEISGLTPLYAKWSLSGSHLLIVYAFSITETSSLANIIATIPIPEWVYNKVMPLQGTYVSRKDVLLFNQALATQTLNAFLVKSSTPNVLAIDVNNLTLTADRTGRIEFDLLIDNE